MPEAPPVMPSAELEPLEPVVVSEVEPFEPDIEPLPPDIDPLPPDMDPPVLDIEPVLPDMELVPPRSELPPLVPDALPPTELLPEERVRARADPLVTPVARLRPRVRVPVVEPVLEVEPTEEPVEPVEPVMPLCVSVSVPAIEPVLEPVVELVVELVFEPPALPVDERELLPVKRPPERVRDAPVWPPVLPLLVPVAEPVLPVVLPPVEPVEPVVLPVLCENAGMAMPKVVMITAARSVFFILVMVVFLVGRGRDVRRRAINSAYKQQRVRRVDCCWGQLALSYTIARKSVTS